MFVANNNVLPCFQLKTYIILSYDFLTIYNCCKIYTKQILIEFDKNNYSKFKHTIMQNCTFLVFNI